MIKRRGLFPTFWIIILVLGLAWFAREMNWLTINLPWLPLLVIIISVGAIINYWTKK